MSVWPEILFPIAAFMVGAMLGEANADRGVEGELLLRGGPQVPDEGSDEQIDVGDVLDEAMFDVIYCAGELNSCPRCSEQLHVEGHEIVDDDGIAMVNLKLHCPGCDEPLYWPTTGEWASAILAKQLWDQVTMAQDALDLEKPGTLEF